MVENKQLQQAMDPLITGPYRMFLEQAKTMFKEETAIQSATASMFIRFGQLADKNPNFSNLIKQIMENVKNEQAPQQDNTAIVGFYHDAILTMYEPIIKAHDNVKRYIEELFKRNASEEKPIQWYDEHIADYMARNGIPPMFVQVPKQYDLQNAGKQTQEKIA